METGLKILFIFVDGLGMGSSDSVINPLRDHCLSGLSNLLANAASLDACLGVEGLPQSATGQTALFTGMNASKLMGRHIEGFPPATLKKLIRKENIFSKLRTQGKQCTFANSYWIDDPHRIPLRRQSVTTVMALEALDKMRGKTELLSGKAVHHDITRWTMQTRGYDGELITEEEAADHLLSVAEENDFTLFEYFLTDRAGHSKNRKLAPEILKTLNQFLPQVARFAEQPNHLFILCSDHGNIEDLSTFSHTKNPVPLIACGAYSEMFLSLKTLTDVTPAILDCFAKEQAV